MASAAASPAPSPSSSCQRWEVDSIVEGADRPKDLVKKDLEKGLIVMLHKKTQIFKLINLTKNYFMVLQEGLTIAWIEDPLYWHRTTVSDLSRDLSVEVQVAELRNIRWLDISGKLRWETLSRNTKYEIQLHAKLLKDNTGCNDLKFEVALPVPDAKVKLIPLDGKVQFNTDEEKEGKWQDISLCEFERKDDTEEGEVKFCVHNHSDIWKRGLVVGGFSFKPM
ncbi:protein PHLOEM PROTEIN 2-LIKE A1-like isoform X2 [Punica granatum]|uniref:Protein PHLOEM PROTEIN 2-LIKE A1-like isoform X2 n=1 Tax=Punica granatum TaxID=22663 RepID=A0A6P8DZR4_PUNGR|nr:protein PHLOEM PROTEIN 2-LIKE A1-like isoform X2 [Punica granatum]